MQHRISRPNAPRNIVAPDWYSYTMNPQSQDYMFMDSSARMKAVRRSGTKPELVVRRLVTALGYSYRLNVSSLPGSPDLVNRSRRFAIFVHGCFWHRHEGCSRATMPATNQEFWRRKFEANKRRDRESIKELERLGFSVCVVWECETRSPDACVRRLRAFLEIADARSAEIPNES